MNEQLPQTRRIGYKISLSKRIYGLILALFVCAILYLTYERILLPVGDLLVVQDRLVPADIIHVIAGDDSRTDHAVHVYQQGFGREIFFTGGWCSAHHFYHGRYGREKALLQGVPQEAISVDEDQVSNTYSEAERLKEFIYKLHRPIGAVIVVTDPHHTRRAKWIFRRVLGDQVVIKMAAVPFDLSPFKRRWWEDEKSTTMVKNEYLKIVYYYINSSWGTIKKRL